MSAPTLVYGGATITLPYPRASGKNDRLYDERRLDRRTLGGALRVQVLSRDYTYQLDFDFQLVSVYASIVSLWETALAAGTYPTFTWTDRWASASSVSVAVGIGPLAVADVDFTRGNWTLELVEVNPR